MGMSPHIRNLDHGNVAFGKEWTVTCNCAQCSGLGGYNIRSRLCGQVVVLVTKSCLTLETPWTVTCQALLSMGFSRQEYWNWLPFRSPGDLPYPGIEPRSLELKADSLLTELRGSGIPANGHSDHDLWP